MFFLAAENWAAITDRALIIIKIGPTTLETTFLEHLA
jgi:hypothetical protein